jgi:hypothetical protein
VKPTIFLDAYLKATHGIELEVLMPVGGNPNRIGWSTRYADLAAMEVATTKMTSDPKYWDIVNAGTANFMAGSIRDSIWRTL